MSFFFSSKKQKPFLNFLKYGSCGSGGRNTSGRITCFHIKKPKKKICYRFLNFSFIPVNVPGLILRNEHCPKRKEGCFLVCFSNGMLCLILKTAGLTIGNFFDFFSNKILNLGCGRSLFNFLPGTFLHSLAKEYKNSQIARAGGSYCRLLYYFKGQKIGKKKKYSLVLLPSGEYKLIALKSKAILGRILGRQPKYFYFLNKSSETLYKKHRKSTVRGVAMNPIDHPHGGGEGKTSGGRPSCSPWGKLTKGPRTKNKNFFLNFLVHKRRGFLRK